MFYNIYKITAFKKVQTDIIISMIVRQIGWTVIMYDSEADSVIMYDSETDRMNCEMAMHMIATDC
jgi:hypothetical protein